MSRLPSPEQKDAAREAAAIERLLELSRAERRAQGIRFSRAQLVALHDREVLRAWPSSD